MGSAILKNEPRMALRRSDANEAEFPLRLHLGTNLVQRRTFEFDAESASEANAALARNKGETTTSNGKASSRPDLDPRFDSCRAFTPAPRRSVPVTHHGRPNRLRGGVEMFRNEELSNSNNAPNPSANTECAGPVCRIGACPPCLIVWGTVALFLLVKLLMEARP